STEPRRTVAVFGPDGAGAPDVLGTLPAVPGVTLEARSVPGAGTGFSWVYELARAAGQAVQEGAHGIVVLQDTDAAAETAWALELVHAGDAPVVLAAAPDRPGDVADAINVAAAGLTGCLLVAHGEIHSARHVSRTGATAFASPGAGPLGRVSEGTVRPQWRPPRRCTVRGPHGGRSPRVGLYTVALGDDGELLRAMARHCDGLVVAASGAGRVPEPAATVLAEVAGRVPVVLASPAARRDALPSTTLDPIKARVLMYLLLDAGRDREAVLAAFAATDRGDAAEV
ncbi:MAG: Asparaginase/glutaminase, partial [Actinoallomurus sp.]|nr:Asparaginase/glutaminase [Actinoallomurus sp.]